MDAPNDIQVAILALRDKGWTLSAIADALPAKRNSVRGWLEGLYYPRYAADVLDGLHRLLERRRIPKRRRYPPGSRALPPDRPR